ncbi:MAG: 4Fe-4S binding protein [Sphaerochaetaceae bacterium]|nr:4Fe-4S binding protein [Sphaerochaetaceae bacterium]
MYYVIQNSCVGCGMCLSVCPVKAVVGGPGRVHAIDENLCIGCGACGRICEKDCITDSNGNVIGHSNKRNWLVPVFNNDKCRLCGKCNDYCPASVITGGKKGEYPKLLNPKLCVSCFWCEKVCMFDSIDFKVAYEAYGKGNSQ